MIANYLSKLYLNGGRLFLSGLFIGNGLQDFTRGFAGIGIFEIAIGVAFIYLHRRADEKGGTQ